MAEPEAESAVHGEASLPQEEGEIEGIAEGAGWDGQPGPGAPTGKEVTKEGKQRTLEQMMSLKPGDDERTELSKKISWILRHGAKKVNVEIDGEGWVRVEDLLGSEILSGTGEERFFSVIQESNAQKARYELKDTEGGKYVRAVSKSRRISANGRERRRRDGDGGAPGDREREREPRELRESREPREFRDPRDPRRGGKGEGFQERGWWPQMPAGGYPQDDGAGYRPRPAEPSSGERERGRGERRGKGRGMIRPESEVVQQRWRVMRHQEAIVREAMAVDSEVVGKLLEGTVVTQIGEDKVLKNGIIRMLIESHAPQAGITGWATRSAEAAGGPVFFKPERPRDRYDRPERPDGYDGGDRMDRPDRGDRPYGGKGKGKGGPIGGKGKRPIGEGEPGW